MVAVAMAASCTFTVMPPSTQPGTGQNSPSAPASHEPGSPSASLGPDGTISWQRVADPEGLWSSPEFENLQGVVAFDGGLLVYGHGSVGGDSGPQEAVIWLTADLETWTARSFDEVVDTAGNASIKEIAANDQGFVAIGDLCCPDGRAVWQSLDGISWTETRVVGADADPERLQLHGVAAAGPGVVVVGEDHGSAAAWFSADGTTWTPADDLGPGTVRDVAPFGSGFIAVGRVQDEPGKESQWDAAVWISEEGLSWARVGETATALTSGDAELGWVVPFDHGVWVLGQVGEHGDRLVCRGDPCAWSKEASWVGALELDDWQGPFLEAPILIDAQNVIASRGGLLTNDGDVLGPMWTSAGGVQWEHWPETRPFPRGSMTALATVNDSTIVAIGNVDSGDAAGRDGAIWFGTFVND